MLELPPLSLVLACPAWFLCLPCPGCLAPDAGGRSLVHLAPDAGRLPPALAWFRATGPGSWCWGARVAAATAHFSLAAPGPCPSFRRGYGSFSILAPPGRGLRRFPSGVLSAAPLTRFFHSQRSGAASILGGGHGRGAHADVRFRPRGLPCLVTLPARSRNASCTAGPGMVILLLVVGIALYMTIARTRYATKLWQGKVSHKATKPRTAAGVTGLGALHIWANDLFMPRTIKQAQCSQVPAPNFIAGTHRNLVRAQFFYARGCPGNIPGIFR